MRTIVLYSLVFVKPNVKLSSSKGYDALAKGTFHVKLTTAKTAIPLLSSQVTGSSKPLRGRKTIQ